jgi:hypothetical protein
MKAVMERQEMRSGDAGARRPTISLAYDGGDPSHLEIVLPTLDELGFKATFFLPSAELLERARDWQAAFNSGHEIGSHSLLGFTDDRGNLWNWTLDMVEEDLRMSRKLLTELFPTQQDFAFAYPGDQSACVTHAYDPKHADYRSVVEKLFRVCRTPVSGANVLEGLNPCTLKTICVEGMSYSELIHVAEHSITAGTWSIFAFGPVGAGDPGTDRSHHSAFLSWLKDRENEFNLVTTYRFASLLPNPSLMG